MNAPLAPSTPPPQPAGGLADLHPAYFAMVMATGIVSIAAHLRGWPLLAAALLWLNVLLFATLWTLLLLRLIWFPRRLGADLCSHGQAVGFFTIVAATSVLGSQLLMIGACPKAAMALWVGAICLWAALTYTIFTTLTVKASKPPLAEGIHGGWLVAVVAAQSVSVLGTQTAPAWGSYHDPVLFFALTLWLGGGMLYIWIIALIFYRYTFFPMSPADLSPPYWINMGAMAISTLAGSLLIAAAPESELLASMLPFLKGFTLLFWATATWWIPMLVVLGFWRHVLRRFPLAYSPLYWGAVFPLGMYTVCTIRLQTALHLPFLALIPPVFFWIALTAWGVVFCGLMHALSRGVAQRFRSAPISSPVPRYLDESRR